MDVNVGVVSVRIGQDAEMKYTKNGTAITKFSGASNKKLKGGDEETSWFEFELWGKAAEALTPYLTKGSKVTIQYEARQDVWEHEGQKRSRIVFVVKEVQFDRLAQDRQYGTANS